MNLRVTFATILLGVSIVHAGEPDTLSFIPQLLAKNDSVVEHGFKVARTKTQWVVTYCPDNTCDVIRAPLQTPRQGIGDFALLWLYYASGYIYLEQFEVDAQPLVESTIERYSKDCPASTEEARAACVLSALATRSNVRLAFRRSDEGATGEQKVDPKEKISVDAIRQTKKWQRDEWEKAKKRRLRNK